MALLKKKKTKIKVARSKVYITDSQKKKYGVCEHNHVNYKFLEKLCRYQQKFIKSQFKKEEDLKLDHNHSRDIHIKRLKTLVKAVKDLRQKNTDVEYQFKVLSTDHKELQDYHKELAEKHEDCLCKNEKILKDHHDITRAYMGLHHLGKEAKDFKVDIKKHQKMLPEYEFHQKHELLESGRVKHIYKIIPKKKKKEKN